MHESDLTAIALKLADGTPVDWERLKAEAPEEYSRLLHRFEQIEHLARVHAPPGGESEQFFDSIRRGVELDGDAPLHWGPLEILRKIGRGSYGDVYLARDPRLDRTVALKLLRKRSVDQAGQTESRIIEEARLLARVRHPNVVTVYGAEIIDERAGVWMEFIDGQTLEEQLQATGPSSATEVREIGTALSGALAAIHDAGLLHRDIKTQNVLRERATGRVVLADFGAGLEHVVASSGGDIEEFAGTPAYLAPEVLAGSRASAQSEVYGLGVLLFRLATGGLPYEGRTLPAIKQAQQARPISCRSLNRRLPRTLARVVDRAIEPRINRRYQSADALGRALAGYSPHLGRRIAGLVVFLVVLWGIGWVVSLRDHLFTSYAYVNSYTSHALTARSVSNALDQEFEKSFVALRLLADSVDTNLPVRVPRPRTGFSIPMRLWDHVALVTARGMRRTAVWSRMPDEPHLEVPEWARDLLAPRNPMPTALLDLTAWNGRPAIVTTVPIVRGAYMEALLTAEQDPRVLNDLLSPPLGANVLNVVILDPSLRVVASQRGVSPVGVRVDPDADTPMRADSGVFTPDQPHEIGFWSEDGLLRERRMRVAFRRSRARWVVAVAFADPEQSRLADTVVPFLAWVASIATITTYRKSRIQSHRPKI